MGPDGSGAYGLTKKVPLVHAFGAALGQHAPALHVPAAAPFAMLPRGRAPVPAAPALGVPAAARCALLPRGRAFLRHHCARSMNTVIDCSQLTQCGTQQ